MMSGCSRNPEPTLQEGYDAKRTQSKTHGSAEQNNAENPREYRMTRGYPPVVAIGEAMHYAERIGYLVSGVNSGTLPCNFIAISDEQITLVRVRRLRYGHYGLPDIAVSCTQEILELRAATPVSEDTGRELWVRGPDRHWHRYTIFPDRIESVEMYGTSVSGHLGQQMLPVD
jgi:hypothetical protein